ncbi:hypothetical protein BJX62DRAFT_231344 [Aspergillus germanicus]
MDSTRVPQARAPSWASGKRVARVSCDSCTEANSCACPSILYLLLEQLRIKTAWSAPDDVIILRNTTKKATGVLGCDQCPLRYFSIIQNGLILGVVATCIAECYARLLAQIDQEELRATSQGQRKKYIISTTSSSTSNWSSPQATNNSSLSFSVEVSPAEWRESMRNIVRAEIHGIKGEYKPSFMNFLSQFEERQKDWHHTPPARDCPLHYHSNCTASDRIPSCLIVIDDAKRLVNSFDI